MPRGIARIGGVVCATVTFGAPVGSRAKRRHSVAAPPKVVVVIVDGLPCDLLERSLDRLEFIRSRLPFRTTAVSCFPSTTGPAYFPLIAGCTPGRANVPGIRWFDRTRPTRTPFPHRGLRSYVGPQRNKTRGDTRATTLFASHGWPASSPVAKDVPRRCQRRRDLTWTFAHFSHRWERADRVTARALDAGMRKGREIVFAVFPSVDELGHVHGLANGRGEAALAEIDRILAARLGDYEGTLIVSADHALTDTRTHIDLRAVVEERVGPTLAFPLIGKRDPAAVVCESGNGMANVYLRGERSWRDVPAYERCRELAAELVATDGIDSVALRGPDLHTAELWTRDGVGELGYEADGFFQRGDAFTGAFAGVPAREALARSRAEANPDAAFALVSLFASERTGDLLVSASPGYDLRAGREWPEHHASHGALHRHHTVVPVLANRPLPDRPLRTLDLFALMLAAAGVPLSAYEGSDACLLAEERWEPGVVR